MSMKLMENFNVLNCKNHLLIGDGFSDNSLVFKRVADYSAQFFFISCRLLLAYLSRITKAS